MFKIIGELTDDQLPDVETNRLLLRQRTVANATDIFNYASLPQVAYPAGFQPMKTLGDERHYLEKIYPQRLKDQKFPSGYGITLKGENKVIGSVDYAFRSAEDILEIGYLLHPDYWGQGIVPEAAEILLYISFTMLNLSKLQIGCYSHNRQSQSVAKKLGFILESETPDIKDIQGNSCSDLKFGLLRTDWEKSQKK